MNTSVREYDAKLDSKKRISENTLHMMDTAVENIKAGITSDEVDLSEF